MSITQFDKSNLKVVRGLINAALTDALAQHGLTATIGNITYSDADFKCKLTVSCGSNEDAAKREFEKNAFLFGLKPDDYGRDFSFNGKMFKLVAIKPRSTKYPLVGIDSAGKRYKFPEHAVK